MKLLVDTSVWSLALRRKSLNDNEQSIVNILSGQVKNGHICMIGPIRQEILSGVKDRKQFLGLQKHLSYFEDLSITTGMYVKAAELYNACRVKGIQGSHIDFLICAVANEYDLQIFTLDNDFMNYSSAIDIRLFPQNEIN